MYRTLLALAVAGLLLGSINTAATAQGPVQLRDGFAGSVGLGGGSATVTCDGCNGSRDNGLSGFLRLGGTLRPNLVLGGEANGWMKTVDGATERMAFLAAVVQWYPDQATGFFVKGGPGIGITWLDLAHSAGGGTISATGLGMNVGLGYDIRIARTTSVTPYVNYLRTFGATGTYGSTSLDTPLNGNLFQYGLAISWH